MFPAMINVAIYLLLTVLVIVCLLMTTVILMQRSKQQGLGTAFGGGGMDAMFGAQTSSVLVKITVWLAVIYFVLTIMLAGLYANRTADRLSGSLTEIVDDSEKVDLSNAAEAAEAEATKAAAEAESTNEAATESDAAPDAPETSPN